MIPSLSFPALGTWIEMWRRNPARGCHRSFPALGTWIEIHFDSRNIGDSSVVPCIGNVDWNIIFCTSSYLLPVVPCIGNVDWNQFLMESMNHYVVVPCIGNVDWNEFKEDEVKRDSVVPCIGNVDWNGSRSRMSHTQVSFPALGTWIEITLFLLQLISKKSFPALGTWIEIPQPGLPKWSPAVVPYTGNVDWNLYPFIVEFILFRRSLHWERGLKYTRGMAPQHRVESFPHRERGLKFFMYLTLFLFLRRSLHKERGLKCHIPYCMACRQIVVPCIGNVDWNAI